ncbi:acyl carrier protein [Yinghuangia sp. ASG 101]|uniref:acyl carrier protein n=1 Tax=Yinghuangia sp. ASG 101 TaxID=2896848 RepID=UPI001E330F1D|nr:acyl carrier protein [Yinghuangia sp. ASG 101]UGQ11902.1 acyl carrier protein [Yinghuangia sp. ASG 101]
MARSSHDILSDLLVDEFDVDRATLTPDATFADLGMNSLALAELLVIAERELHLDMSDLDVDLDPTLTLSEVVEHLDAVRGSAPDDTARSPRTPRTDPTATPA